MKRLVLTVVSALLFGLAATTLSQAQAQDKPVLKTNYEEDSVGDYHKSLPDPLIMNNGKKVKNERQWYEKRRPEIIRMFEENQYGVWPERRAVSWDVIEDESFTLDAYRKQITLYFTEDKTGPSMDILMYIPKQVTGPAPLLINLSFFNNSMVVSDRGLKPSKTWTRDGQRVEMSMTRPRMTAADSARYAARADSMRRAAATDTARAARPRTGAGGAVGGFGMNATVKSFLDAGIAFANINYTDLQPDYDAPNIGIKGLYRELGITKESPTEWGCISIWAWGVSCAIDYLETDASIDSKRIALTGCSRLGKTTIWAGAHDDRIAVVIPSCSGEGGVSLSRRNYGETVAHLNRNFPYQFATAYQQYDFDVDAMPVDAHMLVALVAPRPLLIQTGILDKWADPRGEFISAVEGGKVYRFLGKDDLGTDVFPEPTVPIYHTLGWYMHSAKHGVMADDWEVYLEFLKRYL